MAEINLAEYLGELVERLIHAYQTSTCEVRVREMLSPIAVNVETATPLGLIVNELISNSLKHAFIGRSKGLISISCEKHQDGDIRLCLADDGVGFPDNFDPEKNESLGFKLVTLLTKQLGATYTFNSDSGSSFCLSLNEKKYKSRL